MAEIPPAIWDAVLALLTAITSYVAYRTKTNTAKVDQIEQAVTEQVQTTVFVDQNAVAGQWSPEAKKALEKAIPVGAEIVNVVDSPDYHIVYWKVRK